MPINRAFAFFFEKNSRFWERFRGFERFKFNKPFPVEGIRVWSKRGDETEFMFLNSVSHSPFKDPRPRLDPTMPEVRQYRFMFLVKDEEVGQLSHIVEVLV
jgi:hypothetical protein